MTLAYDIKNYDKFDPLRFLYTHIRNGFSVSFETQMTQKNYFLQITSIRSNLTFVYCFRRLLILLIFIENKFGSLTTHSILKNVSFK